LRREELDGLPKPARDYCNYLLAVRNRAPLTVLEYAGDLRTFFRWLSRKRGLVPADTPWEKIPTQGLDIDVLGSVELFEVYEFIAYCLNVLKNSAKTRARKVVALRRFYKYLMAQKLLTVNPLEHLESPSFKPALPHYLTLDESRELLAGIDGRNIERNSAIITLFLHCGLRLAELVGMNLEDISEDRLKVRGKGGKERVVYLNAACVDALNAYLVVRGKAIEAWEKRLKKEAAEKESAPAWQRPEAVFLSSRMGRISRRMVQELVYRALEKAGLKQPGMSAHKLRHTAATLLYQHGGVDIRILQELLGHANLGTTQIYTHVSSEQLRDAQKRNPLL
jgi:site-specific recombinase XerD